MQTILGAGGPIADELARAPEFYGPDKTKSLTNQMVFDRIGAGKRPVVPLSATTKRSPIWTPDASRAMALLGNTPDAFAQTWRLPIDPLSSSTRTLPACPDLAPADRPRPRDVRAARRDRLRGRGSYREGTEQILAD